MSEPKERDAPFTTSWGTPVARVYGPADVPGREPIEAPGAYPFTRGIHPTGHRGRLWTMRQYAGFGSAAETNKRYRFLLDQGQTGLSVAFDLPTQMASPRR
jgi:methylmalonyl-CoA mutase N-terminal domain/subunit